MDIFEKFFHIWNLWGPMHLSINVWSWSGKKSESWYSLVCIRMHRHMTYTAFWTKEKGKIFWAEGKKVCSYAHDSNQTYINKEKSLPNIKAVTLFDNTFLMYSFLIEFRLWNSEENLHHKHRHQLIHGWPCLHDGGGQRWNHVFLWRESLQWEFKICN